MATVRVLFPAGERDVPAHIEPRQGAAAGIAVPNNVNGWEIVETVLGWIAMRRES